MLDPIPHFNPKSTQALPAEAAQLPQTCCHPPCTALSNT